MSSWLFGHGSLCNCSSDFPLRGVPGPERATHKERGTKNTGAATRSWGNFEGSGTSIFWEPGKQRELTVSLPILNTWCSIGYLITDLWTLSCWLKQVGLPMNFLHRGQQQPSNDSSLCWVGGIIAVPRFIRSQKRR